jgi:type I restriction enzyme M protein
MARSRKKLANGNGDTAATLGFEARLWNMADALRNNMDAAEYKHGASQPARNGRLVHA